MEKIKSRRRLRPLKLGRRSKVFYVFDTETGTEDEQGNIQYLLSARPEHLIFGCVYGIDEHGKVYTRVLYSAKEFQEEFKKKRYRNKLVYAHNAEYDLSAVYGNIYLMDGNAIFNGKFISASNYVENPKWNTVHEKGCPTNEALPNQKCKNCSYDSRQEIPHAKFADSFNLMPAKVEKLGELLGMPKKQLGKGELKSHRKRIADDIEYCFRDCEIVYRSLEKMFSETEPSYTVGSHAVKVFRSQYLDNDIIVDGMADEFFAAMYGGRTEAFKIGECNASVYDINSAYPRAMKERLPDPSRLRITEKFTEIFNPDLGGMITATVEIPGWEPLPCLPVKHEGKLLFPTGTFTGTWVLHEFLYALKVMPMRVLSVQKIIVAPLVDSPFNGFIDTLYAKRIATKDEFLRYQYKLEMNNLYGKLVQRLRDEWKFFKREQEIFDYMRKEQLRRCEISKVVGGYFIRYDVDKIYSHTIPCWGAYITAYVRTKLHAFMLENLTHLLYCDTDSVFLSNELDINETFLGGWKREKKRVINIRTLKDYVYVDFNEKTNEWEEGRMLKGVKKSAEQLTKDADVWKFQRMVKTRESMRRKDNRPPGTFIEQIKLLSGDYTKRIVFPDGSTRPFNF